MRKLTLLMAGLTALLTACTLDDTPERPLVSTADFTAFDAQRGTLKAAGLRDGASKQVSLDAEPEYITVSPDGRTAWISVQESNAVATLDLDSGKITALTPLGFKDHALPGNGLDASDKDSGVNIRSWPVMGAFMPDSVASFSVGGKTYLLSANEGDTRDYASFTDNARVADLKLDPLKFPNAAALQAKGALGRLTVSTLDADTDGDGDADRLVSFGARSMSVWTSDLTLLADTGDLFEQQTASRANFNSNGTSQTFDTRSDNKGPEPEGVTTGVLGARTFAFVGLERTGGVMVLNVSDPAKPALVQYMNPVNEKADAASGLAGDLGPEGLLFIPAASAPGGQALLVVANEVSGSTTLYRVAETGMLTQAGRYQVTPFAFDVGAAEIPAFDPASGRLFVVNGASSSVTVLDIRDPAAPRYVKDIPLSAYGRGANSVAVSGGVLAVAVEAAVKTDPGRVLLLDRDGAPLAAPVTVGALPDMLTFTPDGTLLLVANEGEPNDGGTIDPAGSVSVINVSRALNTR
ncbi:choice-of-anchor I family protein [Deinococcus sp.]|uniref:choice-of-anchor I family protein n=1 Tax=Deinococcus sp. TaxID=47478 RepID=UPI0025C12C34|nr:choice-of-anchor I family protein [Deinococcus sp.]